MRDLCRFSILLIFILFLVGPSVSFAEDINGEIFDLTYSPSKPMLLESIIVSISVKNTGREKNTFVLELNIVKNGRIKQSSTFSFDLYSGSTITFSPTFVLDDTGEHEVIVKLWDIYKTKIYDTEIKKFNVISEVGPFDFYLDILTKKVEPSGELSAIVSLENKGELGTDLKIRLEVECFNKDSNIYDEFVLYAESKQRLQKSVTIPVCHLFNETGLHRVSSDLILDERTLMTVVSEFLINETYFRLVLKDVPEIFEIKQGQSKLFSVYVNNPTDSTVRNLRLSIEKIPNEWFSVRPLSLDNVQSNETVAFIINLTTPKYAEARKYPINILTAADEISSKEVSELKILKEEVPMVERKDIISALVFAILFSIIILGVILLMRRSKEIVAWKKLYRKWGR